MRKLHQFKYATEDYFLLKSDRVLLSFKVHFCNPNSFKLLFWHPSSGFTGCFSKPFSQLLEEDPKWFIVQNMDLRVMHSWFNTLTYFIFLTRTWTGCRSLRRWRAWSWTASSSSTSPSPPPQKSVFRYRDRERSHECLNFIKELPW